MSEAGWQAPPQPRLVGVSPHARLDALRSEGAARFDPARFHYLEVLAGRVLAQPDAVRSVLAVTLNDALVQFDQRFRQAQAAASDELAALSARDPEQARELRRQLAVGDYAAVRRLGARARSDSLCTPLVQLNQYIRRTAQAGSGGHPGAGPNACPEMKSVRRFRETWSRIASEDQVDQAVGRGPGNAGPLNSHALILQSLAMMRSLSPDYLRRFLSHVDSLVWLDDANQAGKDAAAKPKPVRRVRPKK